MAVIFIPIILIISSTVVGLHNPVHIQQSPQFQSAKLANLNSLLHSSSHHKNKVFMQCCSKATVASTAKFQVLKEAQTELIITSEISITILLSDHRNLSEDFS